MDCSSNVYCFFFNDTATTEIYTLSLHDALPISMRPTPAGGGAHSRRVVSTAPTGRTFIWLWIGSTTGKGRSEEHTSELQSRQYLVCRLLLEKKKKTTSNTKSITTSQSVDML